MGENHDKGVLGHGYVPGLPVEGGLFYNAVHGAFVRKSTTGSSQLTGTGNGTFLYNIDPGLVAVDGTIHEVAPAADQALATPANIIANGQSIVYLLIVWKHPTTGATALKVVAGTKATTGSQVAPTTAEVNAALYSGAKWVPLGTVTIARTADTTVTETVNNKVRPTFIPSTPNRS